MVCNLFVLFVFFFLGVIVFGQILFQGEVVDDIGELIIFGLVVFYKNGVFIIGIEIDFDGNYFFNEIDFGIYDVEVSYVGYNKQCVEDVKVFVGKVNCFDIMMIFDVVNFDEVVVIFYKVLFVEQDNIMQGVIIISD